MVQPDNQGRTDDLDLLSKITFIINSVIVQTFELRTLKFGLYYPLMIYIVYSNSGHMITNDHQGEGRGLEKAEI